MTALPRLKARVKPVFSSRVFGTNGISVTKENGSYTIEPDFSALATLTPGEISDASTKKIIMFDSGNEAYNLIALDDIGDAVFTITSSSSVSIGTGSKTFTVESGKGVKVGSWLFISSDADPTANYMVGQVTSYSITTLQVNITRIQGSGSHSDWTIIPGSPAGSELLAANNLSDVSDTSTARSNLGLGDSATLDVGTSTGTVAAGDDLRFRSEVSSVAALAALDTSKITSSYLSQTDRSGLFIFRLGDYAARVAADTAGAIYVASDGVASTTGAWVRQFNGPWWANWFGVSPGNTAADNVTGMNAMMSLAAVAAAHITLAPGVHDLNAKITASFGVTFEFTAELNDGCVLRWTAANGGLDITYTDVNLPPVFRGLNLTTTQAGGGTPLKITGPVEASVTEAGPIVEDIDCRGDDTSADYWTEGPRFVNTWYPEVVRPDIKGKDNTADMTALLVFEACQVPIVTGIKGFHADTGILMDGSTMGEGAQFARGEMVGVRVGIDYQPTSEKPGGFIGDLHINASERCIVLQNVTQIKVRDNKLYKTASSSEDWQAIECIVVTDSQIHDNDIATPGVSTSASDNGITLLNSDRNSIRGNIASNFFNSAALVLLAGSSDYNTISNKIGRNATTVSPVAFAGTGKNNTFPNTEPRSITRFEAGDATPSVGNDLYGEWATQNGSATTITTLDDMQDGQRVRIFINDANTSWTHNGSTFVLKNAANITAPTGAGGFIQFIKDGSAIRECGRSF